MAGKQLCCSRQRISKARLNRQFDALQGVNGALGDAQVKIAKLSEEYPQAASALEGLRLAAYSAALALGAMSFMNGLTRIKPGGLPTGAPTGTIPGAPGVPGAVGGGGALATLGVVGAVAAGGAAATMYAGGIVCNNLDKFAPSGDVDVMSAMIGDTGLAAAIMSAGGGKIRADGWRGKGFIDPRSLGTGAGAAEMESGSSRLLLHGGPLLNADSPRLTG